MTATANIGDIVAPKGAAKATFRTKHTNLLLWRKQTKEVRNHHAELVSRDEGVYYQFKPGPAGDGVLDVYEGQDVLPDGYDAASGEVVEQDAISWLRNHPDLNLTDVGGFHEEGREPGRPLPTDADFLADVMLAVNALDADALEQLLEQEEATHKRPLLLGTARKALDGVRAVAEQAQGGEGEGTSGNGRAAELEALPWPEFVELAKGLEVRAVGVPKADAIAAVIAAEQAK